MKRTFLVLLLVLLTPGLAILTGCKAPETGSSTAAEPGGSPGDVVAVVAGAEVTLGEIEDLSHGGLIRVRQSRYDLLRTTLERLGIRKLIEAEAAERGISPEELQLTEVASDLDRPVLLTHARGDDRRYIVEKTGSIQLLHSDGTMTQFVDIDVDDKGTASARLSRYRAIHRAGASCAAGYVTNDGLGWVRSYSAEVARIGRDERIEIIRDHDVGCILGAGVLEREKVGHRVARVVGDRGAAVRRVVEAFHQPVGRLAQPLLLVLDRAGLPKFPDAGHLSCQQIVLAHLRAV